jgi:hypothetical protein
MIICSFIILTIGLYIFTETEYKLFGILILGIALNIFANYYKLYNLKESNQMTKWLHPLPLQIYDDLVITYNVPTYRLNKKGGLVIWNKSLKQSIYDEIILRDEEISNSNNGLHYFCLYLNINIYIPSKILSKIYNISTRINYNRINYMLTIHTYSIKDGNKLLLQILQIINNNKEDDLIKQIKINKTKYNYQLDSKIYY